jgi:pyruvate/2-oxoacid:ferredoxin oxidoreductase beta subunit/Pyruvate/2-oxoacid:ferredoxin oxidoreductase gamma subunit
MSSETLATYLTDEIGPLPFCPGCGHDPMIKALDKALVRLQLPPDKVVIVTDIGCIGLADRYFVTHAFHGLHGRSITYACGLKLARPELTVIVLKGDGGCGIGGTHLLNVARRNIGITLLVANNFNYGMTGGQHSVTTPTDGLTATTPWGNVEGPMDLCGTAIAAGAPWVCRGTVYDKNLPDMIAEAIDQPGFAMLDIWELCTAYYVPRNRFKKKDLFELIEDSGLATGLLADKPRQEYGQRYREVAAAHMKPRGAAPKIEVKYPNAVDRQTGIVIAGGAGEKIRSSTTTFARAAMSAGLAVTQKDDYPITVMTGHSVSELILSRSSIEYTAIDAPDYFVVLSNEGLKKSRARIARLPETCRLYAEDSLELPETRATVVKLPFVQSARKINRLSVSTVALAALLHDTGLFSTDAYADAISIFHKPDIADINLRALDAGLGLAADTAGETVSVA